MTDINQKVVTLEVLTEHHGLRLDVFISQNLPDTSRSLASKIITQGHCRLNDILVKKSSVTVSDSDIVSVQIPESKGVTLKAQNIPLDVVFEDDDIIVINKEFGMVVHPSAGHGENTLVNALLYHCKTLSMGFHEHRPGIVHRLDKDTGGLIVVAKNQAAHNHLSAQFKAKTAGRIYKAMVYNKFKHSSGTIQSSLIRHPKNRLKYASVLSSTQGKNAITHFTVLRQGRVSYVELKLETGRTHQIRVHLSEQGNPIVNDEIYCPQGIINNLQDARLKSMIKKSKNMFLFAEELHLLHPRTQKAMTFKAPLPKSFLDLIDLLNELEPI